MKDIINATQRNANERAELTFVPSGGLANRMFALLSAYALAKRTGVFVRAVWFREWGMKADFSSVFQPFADELMSISDASLYDKIVHQKARKPNLWFSLLPQKLLYANRIDERHVSPLRDSGFNFDAWASAGNAYMSCYSRFGAWQNADLNRLFRPIDQVQEKVRTNTNRFSPHTIGIHIRRTDHTDAIRMSPTQLFVEACEREISLHSDTKIFLATDDESCKQLFLNRFGGRIITARQPATRNSIEGIRGGLTDMYTLAKTTHIYGSEGSTFSEMASEIAGGGKLTILRKDSN